MIHKEGKFSLLKVIFSLGFCLEDTERYILKYSKVNALVVVDFIQLFLAVLFKTRTLFQKQLSDSNSMR